jgi:N6-adenosine-specific RNA methylase IME4
MKYKTIYADPPWTFRHRTTRGAVPYSTLSVQQLKDMGPQIQDLAATDAHLYMWVTHVHLPDALKIITAWGFRYIQPLFWFKVKMGLGFYYRNFIELLLFSVRGRLRLSRRDLPNYIVEARTKHSQKPKAAYRMIEIGSPAPRVELFARERRDSWDAWGNEVASDICLDVPVCGEEAPRWQPN